MSGAAAPPAHRFPHPHCTGQHLPAGPQRELRAHSPRAQGVSPRQRGGKGVGCRERRGGAGTGPRPPGAAGREGMPDSGATGKARAWKASPGGAAAAGERSGLEISERRKPLSLSLCKSSSSSACPAPSSPQLRSAPAALGAAGMS